MQFEKDINRLNQSQRDIVSNLLNDYSDLLMQCSGWSIKSRNLEMKRKKKLIQKKIIDNVLLSKLSDIYKESEFINIALNDFVERINNLKLESPGEEELLNDIFFDVMNIPIIDTLNNLKLYNQASLGVNELLGELDEFDRIISQYKEQYIKTLSYVQIMTERPAASNKCCII